MKSTAPALLFSGLCALSLAAQSTHQVSPFAQAFADFHSPDPAVVAKAKTAGSLALLFEAELPVIEQDSAVFCSGLKDPDPYIRLQASAIYSGMLDFAPQHAGMILACKDGMLKAALDEDDQTRVNVLPCLALNPRGTPTEAHDVFVKALSYPDARNVRGCPQSAITHCNVKIPSQGHGLGF